MHAVNVPGRGISAHLQWKQNQHGAAVVQVQNPWCFGPSTIASRPNGVFFSLCLPLSKCMGGIS